MKLSTPSQGPDIEEIVSALDADENLSEIDKLSILAYSKILSDQGLPIILSDKYLSNIVGYDLDFIYRISNASSKFYRYFEIPKSAGGSRAIVEPLPDLKYIQRIILREIVSKIPLHKAAHAYRRGYSIKRNARIHVRQQYILKMDLRDFFPSINVGMVYKLFWSIGYTEAIAGLLASIVTVDGILPQGAPTSAAISNIMLREFDERVFDYARKHELRYTRYADDITLSGDSISDGDIALLRTEIEGAGFTVNDRKTRVFCPGAVKIVTGVMVSQRLRAPAERRRRVRQEIYFIRTQGIYSHAEHLGVSPKACVSRLMGQVSYMIWLDEKDEELKEYMDFLSDIQI